MVFENQLSIKLFSKKEFLCGLKAAVSDWLHIDVGLNSRTFERIERLIDSLKDEISLFLEYPYVDRYYRDTYYMYFSSKFKTIERDCIRIHIFDTPNFIGLDKERDEGSYCGYFVVRPLESQLLGRSFISPKAMANNKFICVLATESPSILGVKFKISGFPHVAQDNESQVCAESALWSLMEYYGLKYEEYKIVLPSTIIKNLEWIAPERVLPSNGLNYLQVSDCLQKNGYRPRIYGYDKNPTMAKRIINTYIESGVPVILAAGNGSVGHAFLVIGHEKMTMEFDSPQLLDRQLTDVMTFERKIVAIDDNCVQYSLIDLDNPMPYDNSSDFKIKHFIVPLPKHVYLEAQRVLNFLDEGLPKLLTLSSDRKLLYRLYFTSANSFKSAIKKDDQIPNATKKYILRMYFPHFIWICELYEPSKYPKGDDDGICCGLVLMDTTGNFGVTVKNISGVILMIDIRQDDLKPNGFKMKTYRHNLESSNG
jgi:hypothetical protein